MASDAELHHEGLLRDQSGQASTCARPGMESLRLLIEARRLQSGYQEALEDFERVNGRILNYYFSTSGKSGVVIARSPMKAYWRERRRVLLFLGNRHVAEGIPEFQDAVWNTVWTARSTERGSDRMLPHTCRKVVADFLFTVLVMLISTLDYVARNSRGAPLHNRDRQLLREVGLSATEKLRHVDRYVQHSELQTAVRYYLFGLPLGILVLAAALAPFIGLSGTLDSNPNRVLIAAAAGGVGAIASVMFRITRGQNLEVNLGEGMVVTLVGGAFRPLIGAVFGVALYVLVQGGLLPLDDSGDHSTLMFYIGLSFLAGFSERWAQDTILQSAPVTPSRLSTASNPVDETSVASRSMNGDATALSGRRRRGRSARRRQKRNGHISEPGSAWVPSAHARRLNEPESSQ